MIRATQLDQSKKKGVEIHGESSDFEMQTTLKSLHLFISHTYIQIQIKKTLK